MGGTESSFLSRKVPVGGRAGAQSLQKNRTKCLETASVLRKCLLSPTGSVRSVFLSLNSLCRQFGDDETEKTLNKYFLASILVRQKIRGKKNAIRILSLKENCSGASIFELHKKKFANGVVALLPSHVLILCPGLWKF